MKKSIRKSNCKKILTIARVCCLAAVVSLSFLSCFNPMQPDGGGGNTALYRELVNIPGGTYYQKNETSTQGSSYDGYGFTHTVSSFRMGKYEVTYDLWYEVLQWAEDNGYTLASGKEGHDGTAAAAPTSDRYEPVTDINWRDAVVWCNAYSEKSSLVPVYCSDALFQNPIRSTATDGSFIDDAPGHIDNPYVNWTGTGYRLPTVGEWQYAARYINGITWSNSEAVSGDSASVFSSTVYAEYAVCRDNSSSSTSRVGTKSANQLGIFDMSGNVNEMCWDWHLPLPYTTEQTDYRGSDVKPVAPSLEFRTFMGGCYFSSIGYLQSG